MATTTAEHKFKREFTKAQLEGKHHAKLTPELNKAFLAECDANRRSPADMLRIILEDRYNEGVLVEDVRVSVHAPGRRNKSEVA